ncbi:uncharacterized protein FOBCDRAFT_257831 [Fusarium oxysporum Fo47]|uniref:uncharacterized protein n=1 Tax=Fusarium oxysporum Fo47 TaxID=660027 RepID=UPI0015986561|nr:uncharacterized protein FOBCDRAFT_257831 [Fusarium oxysporum Fo47]QKD50444.1 hypothetical protein FOBCDRAFT_257831 [Fusarium oxysporum Fo47]
MAAPAAQSSNLRGRLLDLNTILFRSWVNSRAPDVDTEVLKTIRIARAVPCCHNPSSCPVPTTEPHLVIHYDQVGITHTSAVAISYTWGRFSRRRVAIGHRSPYNGPSDLIYLELGIEWNTADLQNCLVSLSESHGGFWMDQLCKSQEQEDVVRTLASIPTIYRSLDVVALMTGAFCGCLQQWTGQIINEFESRSMTHEQINELYHDVVLKFQCVNSAGMDSWFDRLWTRQELIYSRRITVLRTSQTQAPCVTREEEADQLQGFARMIYEEKVEAGGSTRDAYQEVAFARTGYLGNAMNSMTAYCRYGNPDYNTQVNAAIMLSRFMRGETIENPQRQVRQGDINGRLASFLYQLSKLGQSSRKATKAWDYVIAIWVDCPQYKPPNEHENMTLPALLEDAIIQLERNFGISPASNAPAGLFGNREGGGLWRPTTYLPESNRDTRDIYGVLTEGHHIPVFENSIPLMSLGGNSLSLSSRARPYSQVFGNASTADVFTRLRPLVAQLSLHSLTQAAYAMIGDRFLVREPIPTEDYLVEDMFLGFLLGPYVPDRPAGLCHPSDWSFPEVNHHDVVYRLVTSALNLPLDACRNAHLEVMLSLEDPPCIGLFKPSVSEACQRPIPSLDERVRTSHIHGHQYATLCTVRDRITRGCSLFETAFVGVGPPALLEVVGIWVPIKHTPLDQVQVLAQVFGRDARLGGSRIQEYQTGDELLEYIRHESPQSLEAERRSHGNRDADQNGIDGDLERRNLDNLSISLAAVALLFLLLAGVLVDFFGSRTIMQPQLLQEVPADSWEICMVGPSYWKLKRKGAK